MAAEVTIAVMGCGLYESFEVRIRGGPKRRFCMFSSPFRFFSPLFALIFFCYHFAFCLGFLRAIFLNSLMTDLFRFKAAFKNKTVPKR